MDFNCTWPFYGLSEKKARPYPQTHYTYADVGLFKCGLKFKYFIK